MSTEKQLLPSETGTSSSSLSPSNQSSGNGASSSTSLSAPRSSRSAVAAVPCSSCVEILSHLLCSVCQEEMRDGPVYCCVNGHNVCAKCKTKGNLEWCPECRDERIDGRNRFAEQCLISLQKDRLLPCQNKLNGCGGLGLLEDLRLHEAMCVFREMQCPGILQRHSPCHFVGTAASVVLHLCHKVCNSALMVRSSKADVYTQDAVICTFQQAFGDRRLRGTEATNADTQAPASLLFSSAGPTVYKAQVLFSRATQRLMPIMLVCRDRLGNWTISMHCSAPQSELEHWTYRVSLFPPPDEVHQSSPRPETASKLPSTARDATAAASEPPPPLRPAPPAPSCEPCGCLPQAAADPPLANGNNGTEHQGKNKGEPQKPSSNSEARSNDPAGTAADAIWSCYAFSGRWLSVEAGLSHHRVIESGHYLGITDQQIDAIRKGKNLFFLVVQLKRTSASQLRNSTLPRKTLLEAVLQTQRAMTPSSRTGLAESTPGTRLVQQGTATPFLVSRQEQPSQASSVECSTNNNPGECTSQQMTSHSIGHSTSTKPGHPPLENAGTAATAAAAAPSLPSGSSAEDGDGSEPTCKRAKK